MCLASPVESVGTQDFLQAILEPLEEKKGELLSKISFTPTITLKGKEGLGLGFDDQEDDIKLNQKSGAGPVSKEAASKQLVCNCIIN